jgi:signal transduction histidine kinase
MDVLARVGSARWLRPAVLAVLLIVLTAFSRQEAGVRPLGVPVVVLLFVVMLCGAGLLAWQRLPTVARLALFGVLLVASAGMVYLDAGGPGYVGGFVAASAASAWPRRAPSAVLCALALAGLAVAASLAADRSAVSIMIAELGALAFYLVGRYSRGLRQRTEQATLLAERQRVAREMHDVLAHSLSGLLLHVESARLLAEHDPADPRLLVALDRANQLAHSGLDEARQAIGMLRDDELPGARSLSTVVDGFQADTGIPCEFEVSGTERPIGPSVGLAVYRVGQEALTNIRKHASPQRVRVHLDYAPHGVRLTVEDIGLPSDRVATVEGGGYGLSGMRERAELLDGHLTAHATGTGFEVDLWIPTP